MPFSDLLPGGVNSPVRSFAGIGPNTKPVRLGHGRGAYLHALDGTKLIDYVHSWGSIIVGHAHPAVLEAVALQAGKGLGFGITTELEAEFAAELATRTGLPMSRAVNSGTEATMTAIRLARGHTNRDLLIKFAGCYHGHADALLVAAGSGGLTFGHPSSAGVSKNAVADTLVLPYNNPEALRQCLAQQGDQVAAIILEPVAGNMNLLVPDHEFMTTLAEGCARHGIVLIADEVMTGLRATPGLAIRDLFGIEPDLACLGKVIGGGLPAAALAGPKHIMEKLAPLGPVYQAGTLAGNPVALAAGLASMRLLDEAAHAHLTATAAHLVRLLQEEAATAQIPFAAQHVGGMAGYYFLPELPTSLEQVEAAKQETFARFFQAMLTAGVLLPPSRFESCFVGLAHDDEVLAATRTAARTAFAQLSQVVA